MWGWQHHHQRDQYHLHLNHPQFMIILPLLLILVVIPGWPVLKTSRGSKEGIIWRRRQANGRLGLILFQRHSPSLAWLLVLVRLHHFHLRVKSRTHALYRTLSVEFLLYGTRQKLHRQLDHSLGNPPICGVELSHISASGDASSRGLSDPTWLSSVLRSASGRTS